MQDARDEAPSTATADKGADGARDHGGGFTGTDLEERVTEALHITAFGVLGVLIRVGLGLLFGPAHGDVTSPTGALFTDLPANAFGSFLLGFIVGAGDAFQPRLPYVHVGTSTGLCGALTTYAGWNQQIAALLVAGGTRWLAALFAIALGLEVSLVSYVLGLHAELAARHFATRCGRRRDDRYADRYDDAYKRSKRHGERAARRTDAEAAAAAADGPEAEGRDEDGARRGRQLRSSLSRGGSVERIEHVAEASAALQGGHDRWGRQHRPSAAVDRRHKQVALLASLAVAASLLAAAIAGAVVDANQTRRGYWLACCLSPVGVILRWQLSVRLNKRHRFLPLGTLVANLLASAVAAAIAGALLRRADSYWANVWVAAVAIGFSGSLSTMSAFVAELHQARRLRYAYMYASVSLFVSVSLGVIVYGPQRWTW